MPLSKTIRNAQSLAISPSAKRLVFVDTKYHKVVLVESSSPGSFDTRIREREVTAVEHGNNTFIAALTFTLEDVRHDGRERLLVLDRQGIIQLLLCETTD